MIFVLLFDAMVVVCTLFAQLLGILVASVASWYTIGRVGTLDARTLSQESCRRLTRWACDMDVSREYQRMIFKPPNSMETVKAVNVLAR